MWILIVFFAVGTGGYQHGMAVNFQEFNTKATCEAAIKSINDKTDRNAPWPSSDTIVKNFAGYCVEK